VTGEARTYDGQYTMAQWWALAEDKERECLPVFAQLIRKGDLVFDIGANVGRKAWIFRQLGARVIAVDPLYAWKAKYVPEFYWKLGQDRDIVTEPYAVTDRPEVEISINRFMPYISSIDKPWMTESAHGAADQPYYRPTSLEKRAVKGITLDALIKVYGYPRFIKVDVEGHEDTAIRTLSHPVYALNMEFHHDWIPHAAIAHLNGLAAYEWNYVLNNTGVFVLPAWRDSGTVLAYMAEHLTVSGDDSWGDLYARRADD
jgi:FkbM family methyltransferase